MTQIFYSMSMTAQRVVAASAGLGMMCSCHSIKHRVVLLMLALAVSSSCKTVTVSKDVILGRGFDCLDLSIGEVEVLSRHEIVLRH